MWRGHTSSMSSITWLRFILVVFLCSVCLVQGNPKKQDILSKGRRPINILVNQEGKKPSSFATHSSKLKPSFAPHSNKPRLSLSSEFIYRRTPIPPSEFLWGFVSGTTFGFGLISFAMVKLNLRVNHEGGEGGETQEWSPLMAVLFWV